MVQTFRPPKKSPRKKSKGAQQKLPLVELHIDAMDHEGLGVAKNHQPIVFVAGALPGETCRVALTEQKKNFCKGKVQEVILPSAERTDPFCPHFNECGGCQTQYIEHHTMLGLKQQAVSNLLRKLAGLDVTEQSADESLGNVWQAPIVANGQHYRRKARLAVDFRRENQPRIGYRGKGSNEVINISECAVLQTDLQKLLQPLSVLCPQLSSTRAIGHIELLQGDQLSEKEIVVSQPLVVFRMTKTIPDTDKALLAGFAKAQQCHLALEFKTGEYEVLVGEEAAIYYSLSQDVQMRVQPNDFMQVNAEVNRQLVNTALDWLNLTPQDKVLDLFCGIGNFSLPMANKVEQVFGLEGIPDMVQRAQNNAQLNGIDNVEFFCKDLEQKDALQKWTKVGINKVVLDPSRAGAKQLMAQIVELKPEKVLYVSCNPATFGRDIAVLTSELAGSKKGSLYSLDKIALLDMFPYTAHTEVVSLFVRREE